MYNHEKIDQQHGDETGNAVKESRVRTLTKAEEGGKQAVTCGRPIIASHTTKHRELCKKILTKLSTASTIAQNQARTFALKSGDAGGPEAGGNKVEERGLRRLEVEHNGHRRPQTRHVRHEACVEVGLVVLLAV